MGAEEDQLDVVVVGSCITDFIRYVEEEKNAFRCSKLRTSMSYRQLYGEFTKG